MRRNSTTGGWIGLQNAVLFTVCSLVLALVAATVPVTGSALLHENESASLSAGCVSAFCDTDYLCGWREVGGGLDCSSNFCGNTATGDLCTAELEGEWIFWTTYGLRVSSCEAGLPADGCGFGNPTPCGQKKQCRCQYDPDYDDKYCDPSTGVVVSAAGIYYPCNP